MMIRRALAPLFAISALTGSCVIIVNPSGPGPGGGIGGALTCATNDAPTAHVYFAMRLDRSTVNLKEDYAAIMLNTAMSLPAAGLLPTHAVLIREDERPVENNGLLAAWGCELDDPEQLPPEMVIDHYVRKSLPDAPIGCATDPLV